MAVIYQSDALSNGNVMFKSNEPSAAFHPATLSIRPSFHFIRINRVQFKLKGQLEVEHYVPFFMRFQLPKHFIVGNKRKGRTCAAVEVKCSWHHVRQFPASPPPPLRRPLRVAVVLITSNYLCALRCPLSIANNNNRSPLSLVLQVMANLSNVNFNFNSNLLCSSSKYHP